MNKRILSDLKDIAHGYGKTLTQLVINWTVHREGITSVLVGARRMRQVEDNVGALGWDIQGDDLKTIDALLALRQKEVVNT